MIEGFWCLRRWVLLSHLALTVLAPVEARGQDSAPITKRAVSVTDAIAMTTLGAYDYFAGSPSKGLVAHFSPDGKRFVVVLRRGNLKQNTNDFSLLLYQTDNVFHSPK